MIDLKTETDVKVETQTNDTAQLQFQLLLKKARAEHC